MHKKEKKQHVFQRHLNKSRKDDNYQKLKTITTIHPQLDDREIKAVQKAIEEVSGQRKKKHVSDMQADEH